MIVSRVHAIVVFLIALELCQCRTYGQQPQGNPSRITVAIVQATSATIQQPYQCVIDSVGSVFVCSPVKGQVAEIRVKENQAVKRGDLLFKVKPDRDNLKSLAKDWDKILSIKAPCDGLVQAFRVAKPSDTVGKGTHVLTLSDNGVIRVCFDISEKHYLELLTEADLDWRKVDLHLVLADHSNYPHVGRIVDFLAGRSDKGAGYIPVSTEFPNPDGVLRPGQTFTLLINRRVNDAILIPRQATFDGLGFRKRIERVPIIPLREKLRHYDTPVAACLKCIEARFDSIFTFLNDIGTRFEVYTKKYVYIIDKNHVAHRREIAFEGDANGILTVRGGINVGDRIVVDGVGRVIDGDKVE
jgi:membrane fusion protein (multidrug efflux system)